MGFTTESYIRRAERDDLETVIAWMEEPDFQYFLYGDPARSPKQIREQIIHMLGRGITNAAPTNLFLLIDSPKHGPIGMMSLQNISWRNRSCTLDLYIGAKNMRGKMAAVLAVFRALEYSFDELNLNRVTSLIYAFNSASWRVLEKTGAKRELVLKKHILRDGALHDIYGYGLLREEFDATRELYQRESEGVSLQKMIEALQKAAEAEA